MNDMTLKEKQKLISDYCYGKTCNTCLLGDLISPENYCYDKNEELINKRVRRILEEQQGNVKSVMTDRKAEEFRAKYGFNKVAVVDGEFYLPLQEVMEKLEVNVLIIDFSKDLAEINKKFDRLLGGADK